MTSWRPPSNCSRAGRNLRMSGEDTAAVLAAYRHDHGVSAT